MLRLLLHVGIVVLMQVGGLDHIRRAHRKVCRHTVRRRPGHWPSVGGEGWVCAELGFDSRQSGAPLARRCRRMVHVLRRAVRPTRGNLRHTLVLVLAAMLALALALAAPAPCATPTKHFLVFGDLVQAGVLFLPALVLSDLLLVHSHPFFMEALGSNVESLLLHFHLLVLLSPWVFAGNASLLFCPPASDFLLVTDFFRVGLKVWGVALCPLELFDFEVGKRSWRLELRLALCPRFCDLFLGLLRQVLLLGNRRLLLLIPERDLVLFRPILQLPQSVACLLGSIQVSGIRSRTTRGLGSLLGEKAGLDPLLGFIGRGGRLSIIRKHASLCRDLEAIRRVHSAFLDWSPVLLLLQLLIRGRVVVLVIFAVVVAKKLFLVLIIFLVVVIFSEKGETFQAVRRGLDDKRIGVFRPRHVG
mmetsp:Transcript_24695/g.53463  ORF Transcript_24695/g.53463 Transcript_24695/m.53463 type:complete len:416 (+) Transcript_24695:252-1499(+)